MQVALQKMIDPAHGRNIPAGQPFARQLRRILPRIGADVREQLRAMPFARIRLDRWVQPLADLSLPHITRYTWDGGEQSARRIRRLVAEKLRGHHSAAGGRIRASSQRRFEAGGGTDRQRTSADQHRGLASGLDLYGARRFTSRLKRATPRVLEIGFDVFNPRVSEAIRSAALNLAQSTLATATMDVGHALDRTRGEIAEGLERGEGIERLNARIGQIFEDPMRAARIAQTEASRAVHAGQLLMAEESEVVNGVTWLASSDACPLCLSLDGQTVGLGEAFTTTGRGPYGRIEHPPAHPHCLLPGTPILASGVVSAMTANYRGTIARIKLSSGEVFACTENHMLLTPDGFIRASALVEGDDVVYSRLRDPSISYPGNYRKPAPIDQVVHTLSIASRMPPSLVPASPEYLHGDGASCDGNVEVVRADGFLRNNSKRRRLGRKNGAFEAGDRFQFEGVDERVGLMASRPLTKLLYALRAATDGGMSSRREREAAVLGQLDRKSVV